MACSSFPVSGNGNNQGYSQSTPWVGNESNDVVPLHTLSNAFPDGYRQANGAGLGGLQDVGFNTNAVFPDRHSPYVEQWMAGFQYSITNNDMLDLTYVGNHGLHMLTGGQQINQLPDAIHDQLGTHALNDLVPNPFYGHIASSECNLADPMIPKGQLFRRFPQYCNVNLNDAPVGTAWFNSLQASYTHRWKSGLSVLASYTFSKFLDNVNGAAGWGFVGNAANRDGNNLALDKSVDGNDITHSLVINYIYELPVGRGKRFGGSMNHAADAILGGWQVSGVSMFKSGFPLEATCNDTSYSFGANVGRCNVTGNLKPAHQTISNWINTSAFSDAPAGTYGNSPRFFSNLRAPGYQNFDLSIQKYWKFTEDMKLQFRGEMFNAFNRVNFYAPDQNHNDTNFGKITNTLAPRDVQLGVKFYW